MSYSKVPEDSRRREEDKERREEDKERREEDKGRREEDKGRREEERVGEREGKVGMFKVPLITLEVFTLGSQFKTSDCHGPEG